MYHFYDQYCLEQAGKSRLRILPPVDSSVSLDFSSNDYLGLATHPDVVNAAIEAARQYGAGSTGSRLLSGNYKLIEAFERQIARDKHTEAALVFSSGYQANMTVLASLLSRRVLPAPPLVFFDRLNHSSLYNAMFLSGVEYVLFDHNDMDDLRRQLQKYRVSSRPAFIVTETVHGMEGDLLPLAQLVDIAAGYNCFLYLDEAHATGLYGPQGYGLSTTVDLSPVPHMVMGTFSKAIGGAGAYVACNAVMQQFMLNRTAGFIYSTAPSPMSVAAAAQAWRMIPALAGQRQQVFAMADLLRRMLRANCITVMGDGTNIVPVCLGDESDTLALKKALLEDGMMVSAIRPPTVPTGTSRLRIAINALHDRASVNQLAEGIVRHLAAPMAEG
ncbi:aminotransferase class I/II-fold pyridoxal phosphate-dependent enzyme [Advenella mimigardefordensis]|uniref:8-amino-7-oxononanoate synthase n=1 Tax=Advenella mimigardefordensis (strain DSM 17166 / LMG 22922 / DPN7) TaxID=1247726 RepID=W0PD98_ADVMD|nr:8-amino-7-oxononanoate synthase [Advenella mimigardefordensis]AHG63390.1 putative 8-amino-7-oxononanoate synthase/2-amino-3-ketobutyrate coenzyme A ligase [Advenella mimigardefordensis DPN7]